MIKGEQNKMISNNHKRDFHFSGAGSNLPPVIIKASSLEEAEKIWREKNEKAGQVGAYEE